MIWIVSLATLVFVALAMPVTIRFAHWSGAIDAPNSDVVTHTQATPLLGGLTVLLAILAIGVFGVFDLPLGVLLGIGVLCTMGLYKDITRIDLSPLIQVIAQLGSCALILQATGTADSEPWWLFAVGVFAGVALINAVNFLDVSDGLCAAVSITICIGLFAVAGSELSLYLAAALLGFLAWNRPKARVFMGDVGSFLIGSVLYFLAIDAVSESPSWLVVALILAVPFAELAATILVRVVGSRAVTRGDASHVSLLLLNSGWSPWAVIGAFVWTTAIVMAAGLVLV